MLYKFAKNLTSHSWKTPPESFGKILKVLVEKGLDVSTHQETLLLNAIDNNNWIIIPELLKWGADPNLALFWADIKNLPKTLLDLKSFGYMADRSSYIDNAIIYLDSLHQRNLSDIYFKSPFCAPKFGPEFIIKNILIHNGALARNLLTAHQKEIDSFELLRVACHNPNVEAIFRELQERSSFFHEKNKPRLLKYTEENGLTIAHQLLKTSRWTH